MVLSQVFHIPLITLIVPYVGLEDEGVETWNGVWGAEEPPLSYVHLQLEVELVSGFSVTRDGIRRIILHTKVYFRRLSQLFLY